ncbi:MAG: DUF2778 domain-containing protein [Bradyrhizobium sp.]|uniref:DUF2778 domain-containing protein n=1 Tax=Bradyrhizobium sp. TaxID=376 RepID=UPI0025BA6865|nr:DUF2778 domain-containing protein [Bradyrhizobium sp.]MBI5262877.1 DUF2778 domain-containing protein [Bradyrhizobium sp.]
MLSEAARVDGLLSQHRMGRSEAIVLVLAALALATGAAAWITDADQAAALTSAALPRTSDRASFEDRFIPVSTPESVVANSSSETLGVSALALRETMLRGAKDELALQMTSGDWRSAIDDEPRPAPVVAVPLPRSRPAAADQVGRSTSAIADATPSPDNRTLLQKLSEFLPGRIKLASLTPDSGLFQKSPDLAALGYDRQTAVYDITARAVYLPSGLRLEAHSGLGSLKDDPENVHQPNVGATPPATYDLRPRERLFHGVRALRMMPVEGSNTLGRSGLLTHSYLLGPNGDSNGCVSIKNYEQFLKAFDDGEISRIVVVPSLSGTASASQRPASES